MRIQLRETALEKHGERFTTAAVDGFKHDERVIQGSPERGELEVRVG